LARDGEKSLKWLLRYADFLARWAEDARNKGEMARATSHYEHALYKEVEALNLLISQNSQDKSLIERCYSNAARYAKECGKPRKAKHLLDALQVLRNRDNAEPTLVNLVYVHSDSDLVR